MAKFKAFSRVDINKIDFSFVFEHTLGKQFFDNTNRPLYGTTYTDLYSITGQLQPRIETLYVAGPNIQVAPFTGDLQSGTLTYVELANGLGFTGFFATGVTIGVRALLAVTTTASTADDAALVAAELGGNDTIILSDFDDVFRGFDGNDSMHGGLGRDTLFGDEGNDVLEGGRSADRLYGGAGQTSSYTTTCLMAVTP